MVVMTREHWSDERLDEFKVSVNQRFDTLENRLGRFEAQMHADIRELRQTVNQMQHTMVVGFIGLGAMIVSAVIFF